MGLRLVAILFLANTAAMLLGMGVGWVIVLTTGGAGGV